jgi:hypothetical protein
MPISTLVQDLRRVGFDDMAQLAMDGEWDASRAEAEAWMKREGWKLLAEMGRKKDK